MSSIVTQFKPGQSGNPGGRKPLPEELKARLRDLTPKAIEALEQALTNSEDRVRLAAATAILDRAYGKPAQQTDMTLRGPELSANEAHLQALLAMARRRAAEPLDFVPLATETIPS